MRAATDADLAEIAKRASPRARPKDSLLDAYLTSGGWTWTAAIMVLLLMYFL
jgi:hypothetical protein